MSIINPSCKCLKCGHLFKESQAIGIRTPVKSEFWGITGFTKETVIVCPECRSSDITDVRMCDKCSAEEALNHDDYGPACAALEPWPKLQSMIENEIKEIRHGR